MSANPNRQFDPVAAAALAGINASRRSLRAVRQDTGAPQVPGESQAASLATQGIQTVAQVSPFNVLARGGGPNLPGGQGQFPLPNPQQAGLPAPNQLLPGNMSSGQFPLPDLQTPQGVPSPQDFVPQNQGSGGSSAEDTGSRRDGGRMQEAGR